MPSVCTIRSSDGTGPPRRDRRPPTCTQPSEAIPRTWCQLRSFSPFLSVTGTAEYFTPIGDPPSKRPFTLVLPVYQVTYHRCMHVIRVFTYTASICAAYTWVGICAQCVHIISILRPSCLLVLVPTVLDAYYKCP